METWEWMPFFKKRWPTIGLTALVALAVSIALTLSMAPVYQATSIITIQPIATEDPFGSPASDKSRAVGVAELMKSDAVLRLAAKKLGMDSSDFSLDFRPLTDSNLVMITADSQSPEEAAKVANGVAEAFIEENSNRVQASSTTAQGLIRKRLSVLRKQVGRLQRQLASTRRSGDSLKITELQDELNSTQSGYEQMLQGLQNLVSNEALFSTGVQITARAEPPTSPSRPNKPLNLLLGLAGGLFAGLALARGLETASPAAERDDEPEE